MINSRRSRAARVVAVVAASALAVTGAALQQPTAQAQPPVQSVPTSAKQKLNPGPQRLTSKTGNSESGSPTARSLVPDHGRYAFLLELRTTPTMSVYRQTARSSSTSSARAAARSQLSRVRAAQAQTVAELPSGSSVLYRTHSVLAGVAVVTDVQNQAALRRLPNVAAVYPITPKKITNSYAVPLQGAPAAWEGNGELGQNSTIAIIDTGIDYTHANFGGPGTVSAFTAAGAVANQANPSGFPTEKVIGGYDLVGDKYNPDPTSATYDPNPNPDKNPLDCDGHGSHVAGSAAGYGENADGSTYTGAYTTSTPFSTMKIGPGMAPQAKLYAFRVFGCEGSTDVVSAALDRAADPNGDGDPSDRVDVVNMSLGSDFGLPDDADSIASDAAVEQGIAVVAASGNAGDVTDVAGSPGNAPRVTAVAASQDAQSVLDGVTVTITGEGTKTYPGSRAALYDWAAKPNGDLAGTMVRSPSDNANACRAYTGAGAAAISGKVVLITWDKAAYDAGQECGSVARGANLAAAGAKGYVIAYSENNLDIAINGSSSIPGIIVPQPAGGIFTAALNAGKTVTAAGTVANSVKQMLPELDDQMADFSSRGIHAAGNLKPDVTAVGQSVFSTASGTGDDGVSENGTSMATPMVAGLSALVRSAHPDWTPEQVKADIMNTAGQDLYVNGSAASDKGATYAPVRAGAGRIKAEAALANSVLAYNATDAGTVSVSFGPVEVTKAVTLTKKIKVQNTALARATYTTAYEAVTSVPGVDYTVSPASLTLSPRSSATVTVSMKVSDPTALTKTVDPTIGRNFTPEIPRETLAEASGQVVLTPSASNQRTSAAKLSGAKAQAAAEPVAAPSLRVPVYAAPRPASVMTQKVSSLTLSHGATQTGRLNLTGQAVDQGSGNEAVFSLAAAGELQATSGKAPSCSAKVTTLCVPAGAESRGADVKYVGVTSDYPLYKDAAKSQAYLMIATHAPMSTPAGRAHFEIYLNTKGDAQPELVVYNTRLSDTSDVFVSELVDLANNEIIDDELLDNRFGDVDIAAYDSDVLMLPIALGALQSYGVDPAHPRVSYGVASYAAESTGPVDLIGLTAKGAVTGSLSANLFTPGVTVTQQGEGPLLIDAPGTVDVTRNLASYRAERGAGLLVFHFHNKVGAKAQVVGLKTTSRTTLAVTPSTVSRGSSVKAKITVVDSDGGTPTGTVTLRNVANGKSVGSAKLSKGSATITYTPPTVGALKLVAGYGGDSSYTASTSGIATVTVRKTASSVHTSFSPSTGKHTKNTTVTIGVSKVLGVTPTGKVKLIRTTGKDTVVASGQLGGGSAKLKFKPKKGRYSYRVSYTGDRSYAAAVGKTISYRAT